jgi:hypothetical protein
MDESDPVRKLELNARNSRAAKTRIGGLFRVIRGAAEVDNDCGALWQLIQSEFHANQRAIIDALDKLGALKTGLNRERATDVLWTLNHPDVWNLLVGERGWTPDSYETWLAQSSCAQLLETPIRRQVPITRRR